MESRDETAKVIFDARPGKVTKGSSWAAIIGTHILRKLSVSNVMMVDSSCADKTIECPCGCYETVGIGDNSIGHRDVWHGSLDIILGPVAIFSTASHCDDSDDFSNENSILASETQSEDLEEHTCRNQLVAETITFSYLLGRGLVPTVCFSKKDMKVFMYDPNYDLLYESSELSLLDYRGNFMGTAVLALWLVLNHEQFCTGVKSSHEELGYVAGFKSLIERPICSVYEKELKRGGCKDVKRSMWKFSSLENSGKYVDI